MRPLDSARKGTHQVSHRFAVSAKSGKHHAFITILPNPIEGSDHGCKVSVIRLLRNFELAFVQVTGFPPETEIAFRGNSEGEVHESRIKTNSDGYGDLGILPAKLGKSKGRWKYNSLRPAAPPKSVSSGAKQRTDRSTSKQFGLQATRSPPSSRPGADCWSRHYNRHQSLGVQGESFHQQAGGADSAIRDPRDVY